MATNVEPKRQDLVVIGASAGGVTALPALASLLPEALPAAVLIVQHLPQTSPRHLVDIVQRASKLPVRWAEDQAEVRIGEIVIAPPGTHLLVDGQRSTLSHGPRENHAKPSINRLFRSAAATRGNSTIGVLLTGMLDDGVAGLDAIKWCGGTTLVQDPMEAEFPDLPRNAITAVAVDRVMSLEMLGRTLGELAGRAVSEQRVPSEIELHAQLDRLARGDPNALDALGARDTARCPECGGPLWRVHGAREEVYRCYLGHAMSCMTLLRDQVAASEEAMWTALRTLEEHAFTLSARSLDARARGDTSTADRYDEHVARLQEHAARQRELIIGLGQTESAD
jgi:two-component system chemotaxis response regulator CheB